MKSLSIRAAIPLFAAAILLQGVGGALAQQPAPAPSVPLIIRKITPTKVSTPEYQLRKNQFVGRTRDWFQITVDYDTAPTWVDEATFTYYVLVLNKKPEPGVNPRTLFKGEVSYINIERGKHKSDIYLHPSTASRFGDIERVAVQVSVGGRLVAMEGVPSGTVQQRWWESFSPQSGYLLNRKETPFAMINFDDYEAIKPGRD